MLREGRVRLWVPEQVRIELQRNRENKIAEALKGFKDQKLSFQFPALCKHYNEYEKLRQYQKEFAEERAKLMAKIDKAVASKNLKADVTIRELLQLADEAHTSQEIMAQARLRYDLRNPPGKRGSLGDAINWETLLSAASEGEPLYFITEDNDYYSPVDKQRFNAFLLEEWISSKGAGLIPFRRLSDFFKEYFPKIKLAAELEKGLLINDFAESGSFAQTHTIVRRLSAFSDFTADQANDIVLAANTNPQIYMIAQDDDVNRFLTTLITDRANDIEEENCQSLLEWLGGEDILSLET